MHENTSWNQKEFIEQCNKSPLFTKKKIKIIKDTLIKYAFAKKTYIGPKDLLSLYYLIFPETHSKEITEETLRKLKIEFEDWCEKEEFIPFGNNIDYSTRPIKKDELLYKMISKTNPLAQELLETKRFRDDFQKFRKQNKIDSSVTNQNIKKWHSVCDKKLKSKISKFLDKILKRYNLSEAWKNSLRGYLFIYSLTPPLFNTIYLEYNLKGKISISFSSKNVSRQDLFDFIQLEWINIKSLKNEYLKDKGVILWKNLKDIRFFYWLQEKKQFSFDRIFKIIYLNKREIYNELKKRKEKDALKKQMTRYKKRYLK